MPGVGFWDTGEFQAVPPILGTAHPTGYPTYVLLGWLAQPLLAPDRRARVPDERRSRLIAVAVAAAVTVAARPAADGLDDHRRRGGPRAGPDPARLGDRDAADPHALHLALRRRSLLLRPSCVPRGRDAACARDGRPGAAAPARRPLARCAGGRRRAGLASAGNHSLTLLLAPADRPVRPGGRARDPPPPRLIVALRRRRGARGDRPRLPRAAAPRRACSGRRSSTAAPATWDGFWYVALGEQFRGALGDPFGDLPDEGRRPRQARDAARFGPLRARCSSPAFVVAALRGAAVPAADRAQRSLITLLLQRGLFNAEIDRYYLGPVLIAWTWLGDPGRPSSPVAASRRPRRAARRMATIARPLERTTSIAAAVARGRRCWYPRPPSSATADAARPTDRARRAPRPGSTRRCRSSSPTRSRELVEHLDAAMVRAARRGPAAGHLRRRRPHDARPAPRARARRDRRAISPRAGRSTRSGSTPGPRRAHGAVRHDPRRQPASRHGVWKVSGYGVTLRDRRDAPRDGRSSDRDRAVARLSYFFPAHNEAANLRGLVEEALATLPASPRRSRSSSSTTAHGRDAGRSRTSSPRPIPECPGRPPPDEPRLRRRAPIGLRGRPLRPPGLHRRRPPVQGGRPRPADRAAGRAGSTPTSSPATGSSAPTRSCAPSTRGSTGSRTGSSSGSRSATSTAPASSSSGRRWRASPSSRAGRSSPPSC